MNAPIWLRALSTSSSIAAWLTLAGSAAAATKNLAPSKDNTLIETPVGNSNGAGDGIYSGRVGTIGQGTRRRAVIAFDLSSIPAGATINAVTLTLQMAQSPDATARIISLHRVNADWGEAGSLGSGSGGPVQPGDATWEFRFFATQSWATSGGFASAASASQGVADIGPYQWTGSGMIADVQSWIASPASNFGWLLLGDENRHVYREEVLFEARPDASPAHGGLHRDDGRPLGSRIRFSVVGPPHPSPAFGQVSLSYSLPRAARVSLWIHDTMGRVVRRLVSGVAQPSGQHATVWDGQTESGAQAASGCIS